MKLAGRRVLAPVVWLAALATAVADEAKIEWQPLSDSTFEQAKKENPSPRPSIERDARRRPRERWPNEREDAFIKSPME